MTNKPEPVVTQQCDHAAAKSFESDIGCSLFADDLQLLAEAFAAHRTAAVARREAEIVDILKDAAECYWAGDCYGDADTAKALENQIKKIQNGGGA